MITQQRLKELLTYDEKTGLFTWKTKRRGVRVGDIAGGLVDNCRIMICVDYKKYFAHRLAWLYVYGQFPKNQIDHINGNCQDNRIVNLRDVNNKQNNENKKLMSTNSTGFRGVSFDKRRNKYAVFVINNGKATWGGYHATAEEAAIVAKNIRNQLFTHHRTSYSS